MFNWNRFKTKLNLFTYDNRVVLLQHLANPHACPSYDPTRHCEPPNQKPTINNSWLIFFSLSSWHRQKHSKIWRIEKPTRYRAGTLQPPPFIRSSSRISLLDWKKKTCVKRFARSICNVLLLWYNRYWARD